MRRERRGEKSQALVEFALVAPVLLLLSFGIIDFGRALYFYVTIGNTAREVARYAESATLPMPTFASAYPLAAAHSAGMTLLAPCPAGPVTGIPNSNQGWLFITEVPVPTVIEASPAANAPGGDTPAAAAGSCNAVVPASGRTTLEVTIIYNFSPVTPLVSNAVGNRIILTSHVTFTTEY